MIALMSAEEKIGQLLMVGFPQTMLDKRLSKHIRDLKLSSFILFKRNMPSNESTKSLNRALVRLSLEVTQAPPLIAIDQEGGSVVRIPFFPPMPSAYALGLTKSAEISKQIGRWTGSSMRALGFNMNLAPVVDVGPTEQDSFLLSRTYSENPEVVSELARAFSAGLMEQKVMPTAKHFPGMGFSVHDPHKQMVFSNSSKDRIDRVDLMPFRSFLSLGPYTATMISHLVYSSLGDSAPAIFSSKIMIDLLRRDLRYSGIAITDDIQMESSKAFGGIGSNAVRAIKNGADMIILSWSFKEQILVKNSLLQALQTGQLSQPLVEEKVLRILKAKAQYSNEEVISIRKPSSTSNSVDNSTALATDRLLLQNLFDPSRTALLAAAIERNRVAQAGPACVYATHSKLLSEVKKNLHRFNSKAPCLDHKKSNCGEYRYFQISEATKSHQLLGNIKKCSTNVFLVINKGQNLLLGTLRESEYQHKIKILHFGFPGDSQRGWPRENFLSLGYLSPQTPKFIADFLSKTHKENSIQ